MSTDVGTRNNDPTPLFSFSFPRVPPRIEEPLEQPEFSTSTPPPPPPSKDPKYVPYSDDVPEPEVGPGEMLEQQRLIMQGIYTTAGPCR